MKQYLAILIFILALAGTAFGQVTYPRGSLAIPSGYTVAGLPASHNSNILYDVRDANSATDCTVGGGSTRVVCKWNGSAYAAVGGSGGGGISGLTTNTIPKATSSTTIGNSQITDDGTDVGIAEGTGKGVHIGGVDPSGVSVGASTTIFGDWLGVNNGTTATNDDANQLFTLNKGFQLSALTANGILQTSGSNGTVGVSNTITSTTIVTPTRLEVPDVAALPGSGTEGSLYQRNTDHTLFIVGPANTFNQIPTANIAQWTQSGLTTTSPGFYAQIIGDSVPRVRVGLNATDVPSIAFGPGSGNRDAFLERVGAGALRFGAPDAAIPVPQVLSLQNVVTGTSNTAGADLTIKGSQSTGNLGGGAIILQTSPLGGSGTSQNAEVTALKIFPTGGVNIGAPTGGDKGAGTINVSGAGFYVNGTLLSAGAGTVTVVGSGALTSTALVTGGGTTTLQTPSATATLDASGNMSLPGTFSQGGTAITFGALPSGATTAGTLATFAAQTYTVTGTNTATAFQSIYHGVPTFTDASAGTVTDLFSEVWAGPSAVAGSLTGTRRHTIGVLDSTSASSSVIGAFCVATAFGTTGTSACIGGGSINAGGAISAGGGIEAADYVNGANGLRVAGSSRVTTTNIINRSSSMHFRNGASSMFQWTDSADGGAGTMDTNISRNAAGVVQVGTTAANASGSLLAVNSTLTGASSAATYLTATNCSDSAGAAACGAAAAGSVVIDAGATTVVVSSTAVTANSQIIPVFDSSLGTRLSVTCNTTIALPAITARTAGTSFTITVAVAPITNPGCFSYQIIN